MDLMAGSIIRLDGVHIEINATEKPANDFYNDLVNRTPKLAQITRHSISAVRKKFFDNFQIIHSKNTGQSNLLITPDFALCADCKTELSDPADRRYLYPFITCTHCGPRFSIIHQLPYDRINTKMDAFQMCKSCLEEYSAPLNRRYFSQTNSCPDCKIKLTLFDREQKEVVLQQTEIINQVVKHWKAGKIVAIKGIGGYLLTCDASNASTITRLRNRKHRPDKPFAVMFPDVGSLEKVATLRPNERKELQGPVAPILLLQLKEKARREIALEEIAPQLNQIGALLPYTPLFHLLLQKFNKPIIATSGNISNAPIVFQDKKALSELTKLADFILSNDREILLPQDDSVERFSLYKNQKIILRRSRGLAPTFINANLSLSAESILAMGAMLKSTFCLLHQGNTYVSQYLGDQQHFDTVENYQATLQHFLQLFDAAPQLVLCDQHPNYASTQIGIEIAQKLAIPHQLVQHHLAHFGAVLGENNLVHSESPVLGVIWDGTGWGTDRQVWGGEFFRYENYSFSRCYHFDYFDAILGDKMAREPRISALSACRDIKGADSFLREKFSSAEWQVYARLLEKEHPLKTSSVGRIFDAVASLLGIMDKQTFEGQAAMQLEKMATQHFQVNGLDFSSCYFPEDTHYHRIPTKTLMTQIINDLQKGKAKEFIAAKFHFSLMKIIKIVANNLKIKKIAFSGGVFQNGLLVDLVLHHLKDEFELFFHQQLPPNDENISFGQLMCYEIEVSKKRYIRNKEIVMK